MAETSHMILWAIARVIYFILFILLLLSFFNEIVMEPE